MVVTPSMLLLLDGASPKELSNEVCAVAVLRKVGGGATGGVVAFTLPHLSTGPSVPRHFDGTGDG